MAALVFSELSDLALKYASVAALAERFGAVLTVLYIRETDRHADISKDEEKLCTWIADTVKLECEVTIIGAGLSQQRSKKTSDSLYESE